MLSTFSRASGYANILLFYEQILLFYEQTNRKK